MYIYKFLPSLPSLFLQMTKLPSSCHLSLDSCQSPKNPFTSSSAVRSESRRNSIMRGSQGRFLKLISSNISKPLPNTSEPISTARSTVHLLTRRRFSSSAMDDDGGGDERTTRPTGFRGRERVIDRAPSDNDFLQNPNPNRPLRGQSQRTFDHRQYERPIYREKRDAQSEDSFLDKFKLGPVEKRDSQEKKPIRNTEALPPEPLPEDADEIFKKMKETGLIPNAVAMLDGLCKDGLVQEAMKLFGLMREKGTIPEVVIYTAVVEGFCKAQKLEDAKRIFKKMQNNGISPNAFSYGVLIQGLCKCNEKVEEAVEFCLEMLEAGHSPNVATFVAMVDCLCREKGVEEAQSFIVRLREKGFYLNDKAVREFLDKKGPSLPSVWEAIFGKEKSSERLF